MGYVDLVAGGVYIVTGEVSLDKCFANDIFPNLQFERIEKKVVPARQAIKSEKTVEISSVCLLSVYDNNDMVQLLQKIGSVMFWIPGKFQGLSFIPTTSLTRFELYPRDDRKRMMIDHLLLVN